MIRAATERLAAAGCDTPRLDAELLLGHVLGVDRAGLATRAGGLLSEDQQAVYDELIARRAAREPVAYILGTKGFRHVELLVDPRVLVPRPDTETLVEEASRIAAPGARVHDVGTGSGAVALALADERHDLLVSASDVSTAAVEVARANAASLGLDVRVEQARGLPKGDYDVIVANLPYVREDEWDGLPPEVRLYEPRVALVSGRDGLDAVRALIAQAPSGTLLALEHAPDQGAAVRALLRDARTVPDLAGRDRVTSGSAP